MIAILNAIIASLASILTGLLSLLPASPFVFTLNIDDGILAAINWIFPVAGAITHFSAFCIAVALYYLIRIPLKWIRAAGN